VKISASAVELGFEDDFWESRDFVFINDLSVRSSICAEDVSVRRGTGFLEDFLGPRVLVFVNGF
jgi:hypothetical protein